MHVFDITAQTYDEGRAKLIPCFEGLYGTAVGLIPAGADHILDLGAGTGLLSGFVRSRFPAARLHLIDKSQPMLAQAERRFSRDPAVLCQLDDYATAEWGSAYDPFDAIISALSIHHLHDGGKKALFTRIRAALKPGGIYVNAEQILQPTAAAEAEAKAEWLKDVRALGATEAQIADSLLRQIEDRCATIDDQLQWLREAGLHEARCPFADGRFAVFTAE